MSSFNEDRKILRALAQQYAGIAALDAQKVNEKNWRAVYSRKPNKPMMTIDQICRMAGNDYPVIRYIVRCTVDGTDQYIGEAIVLCARTRPKYIGGPRAEYQTL